MDAFAAERARVVAVEDDRRALAMAAVSAALVTLAVPVAQAYAERKEATGLLDYDDLIGRTSDLLVDPGAAWVLYKLDGGLDHLLLDEVQDTAPAQWRIAHALTEEFFAGAGAREAARTVFAVGDRKQSIYSFQGADADEFDRARDPAARARDRRRSRMAWNGRWTCRSARPRRCWSWSIAVFADPIAAAGVVEPGQTLRHYADRAGHAGAVELWPLAPPPDGDRAGSPGPCRSRTTARPPPRSVWPRRWRAGSRAQIGTARRCRAAAGRCAPGDVMVLVRRRNDFARALVRALKGAGVPVAGLDRMVLTEQPAVQDLMALADALLLPQDDLTFACVLTSPLGGLTDDRPDGAGRRPHGQPVGSTAEPGQRAARVAARRGSVSPPCWRGSTTSRPHALLAEALGPLGGRARLFARLGPEAAEPVDELLDGGARPTGGRIRRRCRGSCTGCAARARR